MKQNWLFVHSQLTSPKCPVKNKTSFDFFFYYKSIASIKNIKQNIGENIILYSVGFTKPAFKICQFIHNHHTN